MRSITRHKSYAHPLHPDLTPDVLTCILPLGTVSSGRESEVESECLFLTIIQFFSACHLTSQHTSTCIHNSIISHSPTHYKSPEAMGEWRGSRCRIQTGSCSCRPAHRRLSIQLFHTFLCNNQNYHPRGVVDDPMNSTAPRGDNLAVAQKDLK